MKLNDLIIESTVKTVDEVIAVLDMYDIERGSVSDQDLETAGRNWDTLKEALNTVLVCYIAADPKSGNVTTELKTDLKFIHINGVRKIMNTTPPMNDPAAWLNSHIADDNLSHQQKHTISKFFPTFWDAVKKYKAVHFYAGKFGAGKYVIWVVQVPKDNTRIEQLIKQKKLEDEIRRSAIKRKLHAYKKPASD